MPFGACSAIRVTLYINNKVCLGAQKRMKIDGKRRDAARISKRNAAEKSKNGNKRKEKGKEKEKRR